MNHLVLEKYRTKKKLSCREVAEKVNKTAGWYSKVRKGSLPLKAKYIVPLSELFGIRPERLAKEYFSGEQLEDTSIV